MTTVIFAWIQLYTTSGHSLTVDYDDEGLDDFDAFWVLDPTPPCYQGFANDASSWRWYAPPSCSILASDVVDVDLTPFNGERIRTLAGTGHVEHDDDLSLVFDDAGFEDMYERVDRVHYPSECDDYYGGPFALFWDVEHDGTYLALGNEWSFDASELDGPSTVEIPVEARYATRDGPAGHATVTITIRNVPPKVAPLALTDAAGNRVGIDVPYVLTNLPVTASATFTDPGIPDHQTASLDWGDGVVDPSNAFATFSDAFGDVFGQVVQQQVYPTAGDGTVMLTVVDDDDGAGSASADVTVVSPEEAILDMIARVDALLATATDPIVKGCLLQARRALAGPQPGNKNGALGAVQTGHYTSATAFVYQAVAWLQQALAAGADVGTIIKIGEQLILALGTA